MIDYGKLAIGGGIILFIWLAAMGYCYYREGRSYWDEDE